MYTSIYIYIINIYIFINLLMYVFIINVTQICINVNNLPAKHNFMRNC